MLDATLVLVYVYLTHHGLSLTVHPLLASNGSSLCAVEIPSYEMSTEDILGIPPGVPGSVRCAFYCNGMNNRFTYSGFNYLVQGSTSGICQFYSQPPSACKVRVKGCMYYEVNK